MASVCPSPAQAPVFQAESWTWGRLSHSFILYYCTVFPGCRALGPILPEAGSSGDGEELTGQHWPELRTTGDQAVSQP
jgi:hypothetical protein